MSRSSYYKPKKRSDAESAIQCNKHKSTAGRNVGKGLSATPLSLLSIPADLFLNIFADDISGYVMFK
jgi:hypothetical protein